MTAAAVPVLDRAEVQAAVLPPGARWRRPRSVEVNAEPQKLLDRDANRLGAWIQNLGGQLELQLQLPAASLQPSSPLPLAAFICSAGVAVPSIAQASFKSFLVDVDVALTWVGAGQSKVQFVAGRKAWGASSGAGTQAGGIANENAARGAAANWGPNGTTIAVGSYGFDASDIANLQWPWPFVGLELQPFAALTAGAARVFLELEGGPNLMIGPDRNQAPVVGDRAGSWAIQATQPPFWVPTTEELWASAGPGGTVDCRLWEVMKP